MKVLLVDDEALARARLRTLLDDADEPTLVISGEAATAEQALGWLRHHPVDLVLLDVHMPGNDGLQLAQVLRGLPQPPTVVFVTAHPQHALTAFEIEAVDYLTKPVRLERLQQMLRKVKRTMHAGRASMPDLDEKMLLIRERGRIERVALSEVLYFRADLKYLTVRTAHASFLMEGALNDMEHQYGDDFLRVHRNALVARRALRALDRSFDARDADGWVVRLAGIDETLPVSRRQLAAMREALAQQR